MNKLRQKATLSTFSADMPSDSSAFISLLTFTWPSSTADCVRTGHGLSTARWMGSSELPWRHDTTCIVSIAMSFTVLLTLTLLLGGGMSGTHRALRILPEKLLAGARFCQTEYNTNRISAFWPAPLSLSPPPSPPPPLFLWSQGDPVWCHYP